MASGNYIVSDTDEELLILAEFKQSVDLQSIKLYASKLEEKEIGNASPPKHVEMYTLGNVSKNFDDIHIMKPVKVVKCSSKKLVKGQQIKLKSIKFKKIKHMAIFIASNQIDSEQTYLTGITFYGKSLKNNAIHKIIDKRKIESKINLKTMNLLQNDTSHNNEFDKSDTKNVDQVLPIIQVYSNMNLPKDIGSTEMIWISLP
eukprot:128983_1